ncbi:MAG: hypothetical protein ACFFC1_14335 [Promethearchaeota archaeon]
MENRNIMGLVLFIVGLIFSLLQAFGNYYLPGAVPYLIGIPCIIVGIYLTISKPKPLPEWRKDIELVRKKSKHFFIAGTIFIGFASLGILGDSVFYSGGFSGIITLFPAVPAYFFGVLFIAYSIHLIGNKCGWLDLPIALIICIVALFQIIWVYVPRNYTFENFGYRLAWFLVFPLNYVVLLILFAISIMKSKNKE